MPAADASGEFALIRRYFADLDGGDAVRLGVGDDAALLGLRAGEVLAVSTDTQLDGVHFPSLFPPASDDVDSSPAGDGGPALCGMAGAASRRPALVAYRAVAAAVSDLAAMGARPLGMTLALTLPTAEEALLESLRAGLDAAVAGFSLPLVGGDTTRGPLALTVTALGAVAERSALRRDGARPGDLLYVSGTLGDAAAGLAVLQGRLQAPEKVQSELLGRFWAPEPRLTLGTTLCGRASAAIDVSDGLLADAGHLAGASGVQLTIDSASLPLSTALLEAAGRARALDWALGGGDDYELCFTLAATAAPPPGCTCIGHVSAGSGVSCDMEIPRAGYEHFA